VKVTFQPNIGLDSSTRQSVVAVLNVVLADEAVLSTKTRLAKEHSSGESASELFFVFETHQKQIDEIAVEIAERISILGGSPPANPEELTSLARLDGQPGSAPDVMSILADHEAFIRFLREDAQVCSEVYEDQGTFALFVSVMRHHEKMAWKLRAQIGPNIEVDENQKDGILKTPKEGRS
jgi:starvation-inducible DNA-binding protein